MTGINKIQRSGQPSGSAAIVHDYLNQFGGAERVVLELARMWPGAPIYTSIYKPEFTFPEFRDLDVRASRLNQLPLERHFRAAAPLIPLAFRSFGTLEQDLVISSSSGWAHGVRTARETVHVVLCYAPARWLYQPGRYFDARARPFLGPLIGALRRWDVRAARRATAYVAIAENVRTRIRQAYGIESEVVHPPVDVERFSPRPRGERLLVVSRLLEYKRIDLAVSAASALGMGLDVVGSGPAFERLRALAGPTVAFHRRLSDHEVTELFERCRAVVMPGVEDFGLVPIEGLAAGKPAIAFAGGGALETLEDGTTAALFREPTVEAVVEAIRRAETFEVPPERLAQAARRFAPDVFRERFRAAVERAASW
jgi:glycosyltransferase involved in cell wall biosynthesis